MEPPGTTRLLQVLQSYISREAGTSAVHENAK